MTLFQSLENSHKSVILEHDNFTFYNADTLFIWMAKDIIFYHYCNEVDSKGLLDRTLFFLFRKGVPPLLTVSVTVLDVLGLSVGLDLLSSDFSLFVFVFVFGLLTDLDLDFGLGLGFTVLMKKYARYKFRNGFGLQLTGTILSYFV